MNPFEEAVKEFDRLTAELNERYPDSKTNYISVGNARSMSSFSSL